MKFKIELISNFKSIIFYIYLYRFRLNLTQFHIWSNKSHNMSNCHNNSYKMPLLDWKINLEEKAESNFFFTKSRLVNDWIHEVDMIIILFLGNLEFLWICSSDLFYGYSLVIVKISASPDWRPLNVWMWYENCFRRILK